MQRKILEHLPPMSLSLWLSEQMLRTALPGTPQRRAASRPDPGQQEEPGTQMQKAWTYCEAFFFLFLAKGP